MRYFQNMYKRSKRVKKNDQKTIAVVINTSWNIFNFRLGLLKSLQLEGYRIVAIAPKDDYSQRLEALGVEYHEIKINNKGVNPIEDAKLVYDFYRIYKKIDPDVLLHYTIKPNIYGTMAGGLLGIPVISNISGLGTVFLNDTFSARVARFLYRVALKIPKKVFYQNADDRELFVALKLVNRIKTALLPGSGIDTQRFKPLESVRGDTDGLQFLFIARLVKDKGLVEYVEAAKIIKREFNATFGILGSFYSGNPTAITEEEMKVWEEEGGITYLGVSDDVKLFIAEADCIVLPSYREGLSRVLLEAASMAKPIITTNVAGCKEVVDDGVNGYLCEVKDAFSLHKQMKKMIALSKEERNEMGMKGREKVIHEFEESLVIEAYKHTIKDL